MGRGCRHAARRTAYSFAVAAGLLAVSPAALSADPPPASPPAHDDENKKQEFFDVIEFRVLGNSVLPVTTIERAVYPFEGPHKTIEDVQAARAALEKAYHDAGYGTVFVDIPEQDIGPGVVRLRATEGRLDRVRVSGVRYFSGRRILAELPAAKPGEVPQLPALQAELAAVNAENADRTVTPVLKAGRTPGTVDLELQVNDSLPLHGGLTLNNRYTPDTSQLRSILDLSYGNLFQDFHNVAFEYQVAPQHPADEKVYSLTYVAPLPFEHDLLAVYAVDTNSNVAAVGALNLLGIGQVYGVHLIHPFASNATFWQNLNFGADFKDFSQTVNVVGAPPDKTPIRYINWSLVYSLNEHTQQQDTSVNIGVDFGIRGLPNDSSQFDYKRYDAQADYLYLKGQVERRQSLPFGTSIDVRLGLQLVDDPLISNEQLGLGGIDSVRGYLESLELADSGGSAQVELRTPTWNFGRNPANNHIGAYVFYDRGYGWIIDPLPAQQSTYDLESVGAGVRFILLRGFDGMLEWADPLKSVSTVMKGHSRLEFQAHYGF
jgi:hemolysin activation/secretion protein